jgi:glycosyltransferase involved in cell wall biosynthesis
MSSREITYTVFTPTYNRARFLPVLFESLCTQTLRDFEWLIVDDGSDDDTASVVSEFESKADFSITYVVQAHGGKYKAVNLGVQLARGKFFGIADSDDYYCPAALERCTKYFAEIPDYRKDQFVGMTGLCATPAGQLIGARFPKDVFDSDALGLVASRVGGDKAGFLRTEIMRQFPFPEDLGSFVPEGLIWNRIARRYLTRYFNEIVMFRDYQPDGLSAKMPEIRISSPRAARQYYLEFACIERPVPIDIAVRYCSNYVRFSLHAGLPLHRQISCVPSKALYAASAPLGWALYVFDKLRSPKKNRVSRQTATGLGQAKRT